MYTNSVTASGNTKGAIFIPIADSIWLRIWIVIASKNNCTPPGTPVEVTLDRKKNARAMTMTAARAEDATVSTLTVRPNHCAVSVVANLDGALSQQHLSHRCFPSLPRRRRPRYAASSRPAAQLRPPAEPGIAQDRIAHPGRR